MNLEKIGETTIYEFNWVEQLLLNAALKHVDRQRRAGISDSLPLHSAMRAIFTDKAPRDDSPALVRWIIDEDEYLGHSPDEACAAPSPQVLVELMQHVNNEITSGNQTAQQRPIGRITLTQPLNTCTSQTTYRSETLAEFAPRIKQFAYIIGYYA